MTSRASSAIKHNSPYAFVSAFAAGSPIAVIYAVAMIIALPVLNMVTLFSTKKSLSSPSNDSGISKLSDMYNYQLIVAGNIITPLIIAATVILSIFMGIMMFRFITSKKTVNVFYSLGIKRTSLFLSRYFAGLIMLFVCIAAGFIFSGIVSMVLIGSSAKLVTACLFGIICIFSLSAFCFSLTAAVFSCVGTSVEGVGFTGIVLLVPSIFFFCLQKFGSLLLYGCPYPADYYTLANGVTVTNNSLINECALFNPLLYVNRLLVPYTAGVISDSKTVLFSEYDATDAWANPSFLPALIWLGVAAVAAAAAALLFKRRKSEICGFLGANSVLNFVVSFIAGFGGFTIAVVLLNNYGHFVSLAVGCAVLVVIYWGLMLSLKRSFKLVFKKSYLLACQVGVSIIIFSVFLLGGFGYSSKLPSANDIDSVQVSGVTVDSLLAQNGNNTFSYSTPEDVFDISLSTNLFGDFKTENDIKKVISLHGKFIELGSEDIESEKFFNSTVLFRYKLKSGKILQRYYTKADIETLKMCLGLDETDCIKALTTKTYTSSREDTTDEYGHNNNACLDYENGLTIAVDRAVNESSFTVMSLTPEQHKLLKNALALDLASQTKEQRYTPEKPALGAIWFTQKDSLYQPDEQGNIIEKEILSADLLKLYMPTSLFSSKIVYITEDMTQTIKFLNDNDLMKLFKAIDPTTVERVSFRKAVVDRESWMYRTGNALSLEIIANNLTADGGVYYYTDGAPDTSPTEQNTITDKSKISQVLPLMHMRYYTFSQGYACYVKYSDGSLVKMYISEKDAPDFVKYFTYQ